MVTRRRPHLVLLAILAMLLALAPATTFAAEVTASEIPDGATPVTRVSGANRTATAVDIATTAYSTGSTTVVLARDDSFPDALAGAYLAGQLDAPLLLTNRNTLSAETSAAITTLGATDVRLLGGTSAISQGIEDALNARAGVTATRHGGTNRYDTARVIIGAGVTEGTVGTAPDIDGGTTPKRTGLLVTGENFPDALAAGALAAGADLPIFLTAKAFLPGETQTALAAASIEQVYILGGTGAVSAAVDTAVQGLGISTQRISGASRHATAAAVAQLTLDVTGWAGTTISVATGANFPDALALAPLAGRAQSPILLAETPNDLGSAAFDFIASRCGSVSTLYIAGGTAVIGDAAANQASLATVCADLILPLSGSLEIGNAGDPDGSGLARIYYGSLCYQLSVSGIATASSAHIHRATDDGNGGVIAFLRQPGATGFSAGCLADGDVALQGGVDALVELLRNNPEGFYINVHNVEHLSGALRGNLGGSDHETTLSGYAEVVVDTFSGAPVFDQGDPDASGTASVTVLGSVVCYEIAVEGLSAPVTGVHIHRGVIDTTGGVAVALPHGANRTDFRHGGCVETDATTASAIADDGTQFYVNVHTGDYPAGAIRGQLAFDHEIPVSGYAEVAAGVFGQGDTAAAGVVSVSMGPDRDGVTTVCAGWDLGGFDDAGDDITGAHIHAGAVDETGAVVVNLDGAGADAEGHLGCVIVPTATAGLVAADPAGHYVNIHTANNPAGAVRGQVEADLLASFSGVQEVAAGVGEPATNDPAANGAALFYRGAATEELCYVVLGSGFSSEPVAGHVHVGAAGANGGVVLGLWGTGFSPSFTGALPFEGGDLFRFGCVSEAAAAVDGVEANPDGHYINIHTTDHPGGAARGQLFAND